MIKQITEGMTGQEAADIIYDNDTENTILNWEDREYNINEKVTALINGSMYIFRSLADGNTAPPTAADMVQPTNWEYLGARDASGDTGKAAGLLVVSKETYMHPRGGSEVFGNDVYYDWANKDGIGNYTQMATDTLFNIVQWRIAQPNAAQAVYLRAYTSPVFTTDQNKMQLLEEINYPAGAFNTNIDAIPTIKFKGSYIIKEGHFLILVAYSKNIMWGYFNSNASSPVRGLFYYTVNNPPTLSQKWTYGWGLATGANYQTSVILAFINEDLSDKIDRVPLCVIPSRIFAIRNIRSVLYYGSFITGDELNDKTLGYKVTGDWNFRGQSFDDAFSFTPSPTDGTGQSLALRFYDIRKRIIGSKNTGISVVGDEGLNSNKLVIVAGNSLTANGIRGGAARDLINGLAGAGKVTLIGTRSEGSPNEGHSGQNIAWFAKNIASPFVNPATGLLDIPYYLQTRLGLAAGVAPDLLDFMEMTNTIGGNPQSYVSSDFPYTEAMDDLKAIFSAFLAEGTKKIIVQLEPIQGSILSVDNLSWTKQIFIHNANVFHQAILKTFDAGAFDNRVAVGFARGYIHRFYGYRSTEIVLNPNFPDDVRRISAGFPFDSVHPSVEGSTAIGQGTAPQMLYHLKELE